MTLVKNLIDKIVEWFCISIMGIMTVLVTWQVITRYFFNNPSVVTEQLAQYLFVWLVMYGAAYVFGKRDHMAIVFLVDKMPPGLRKIIGIIQEIVIGVFASGVMVYGGYKTTVRQMAQMDASLKIPMGVIYSAVAIGGIFIIFYSFYNIMTLAKNKIETNR
ncbi:MAG TPA: TRAP transporter small permease [Clostridiales bacterium UBA8960]|nr:TRAP transporter small permease [Clostridiales bacterium UBA8960]